MTILYNIDVERTLKLVEEVIGFYNVSKEVDQTIKNGPSSAPLDEFMSAMTSIESAVKHFERNNSQSVELENLVRILSVVSSTS